MLAHKFVENSKLEATEMQSWWTEEKWNAIVHTYENEGSHLDITWKQMVFEFLIGGHYSNGGSNDKVFISVARTLAAMMDAHDSSPFEVKSEREVFFFLVNKHYIERSSADPAFIKAAFVLAASYDKIQRICVFEWIISHPDGVKFENA
jgi:hypothetical protein